MVATRSASNPTLQGYGGDQPGWSYRGAWGTTTMKYHDISTSWWHVAIAIIPNSCYIMLNYKVYIIQTEHNSRLENPSYMPFY